MGCFKAPRGHLFALSRDSLLYLGFDRHILALEKLGHTLVHLDLSATATLVRKALLYLQLGNAQFGIIHLYSRRSSLLNYSAQHHA